MLSAKQATSISTAAMAVPPNVPQRGSSSTQPPKLTINTTPSLTELKPAKKVSLLDHGPTGQVDTFPISSCGACSHRAPRSRTSPTYFLNETKRYSEYMRASLQSKAARPYSILLGMGQVADRSLQRAAGLSLGARNRTPKQHL
jgi:hypothetical protein